MRIFLIGTSTQHLKALRYVSPVGYKEFMNRVRQTLQNFDIHTIAEAMNVETLHGEFDSLCLKVSKELSISHIYCESGQTEHGVSRRSSEAERSAATKRENEWLTKIKGAEFPLLFVCDSIYVDSFAKKCRSNAIQVMLLERNWTPTPKNIYGSSET